MNANLECTPIRSDYALPPLHEALLVANNIPNLDNVAGDAIVQNLDSLAYRDAPGQQFD
jgi:hypothetical protein